MICEIKVLPHQKEFIESDKPCTAIVGAYGSAKSFSGTLKTIIRKLQYPDVRVAYFLPNYPLIKDIAFTKFPEMCNLLGLHYQLNKTDKELHIKGFGTILFRNLSEPETIVGFDVGYACIDEIDIMPMSKAQDAYQKILARCRTPLPKGKFNQVDLVSTPEGYRFLYSHLVTNANANQKLIRAKTVDNPYLPADYIDKLKENYDERLLKQYLEGEFININGSQVYHQFNRDEHVIEDKKIDIRYPLIISFDFNISPYNAIYLIQEIDGIVYVIDNAIKQNASLVDSLDYLKQKFSYLGEKYLFNAKIYGDASGRARSQGTARTNYDFILNAGFKYLYIKKNNPRVADRVNVVNSMLKNGNGKTKLYICKKNTELISDFEFIGYDKNGNIDKNNLELSHSSDSIGYYCEYEHSILSKKELRVEYAN